MFNRHKIIIFQINIWMKIFQVIGSAMSPQRKGPPGGGQGGPPGQGGGMQGGPGGMQGGGQGSEGGMGGGHFCSEIKKNPHLLYKNKHFHHIFL